MFRKVVLLTLFLHVFSCLSAQKFTFWVAFADKKNSPYSLDNPLCFLSERALQRRERQGLSLDESDLPVTPAYVDSLTEAGTTLLGTSRWLNGATVQMNDTVGVLKKIRRMSFVSSVQLTKTEKISTISVPTKKKLLQSRSEMVDSAFRQNAMHELNRLHDLGFKGDGIHVAVLDAGFANVDRLEAFDSLRMNNRLLGVRDFVDASADVYRQHAHGLAVLSTMAANIPNVMVGAVPRASYWLLRTEDDATESLSETDNWVRAIEFADSVGVDVVNSSLSYSSFDDTLTNFSYNDMNGRTARISLAATMAARKGMLVVNSAGNDGNKSWHYVAAPADADSIVTVGGVYYSGAHCAFSSYGPTSDNRIKPTLCAVAYDVYVMGTAGDIYGSVGTSFASPIVAGAAACLWQALPQLTNMQLIDLLKSNASQSAAPDNVLGYGIPNVYQAYCNVILNTKEIDRTRFFVFPNPFTEVLKGYFPEQSEISIFDLKGRCLFASMAEGNFVLNTKAWQQGVYLLRVKNKNGVIVEKIVKR